MNRLTDSLRRACRLPAKYLGAAAKSATVLLLFGLVNRTRADQSASDKSADFNRVIRPILSENCYKCHGPDDGARKSNLRFDVRAEALRPAKSGRLAIMPGAPEKSEMVARITA